MASGNNNIAVLDLRSRETNNAVTSRARPCDETLTNLLVDQAVRKSSHLVTVQKVQATEDFKSISCNSQTCGIEYSKRTIHREQISKSKWAMCTFRHVYFA